MGILVAVVDDEPLARSRLVRLLKMNGAHIVSEGQNGQDAIDIVREHEIDILFIDINMPLKNGIDAVKEICTEAEDPPAIVFCTAYDQYAVDAFQTNAVAYLLKPIQGSDVSQVIEKAATVNKFQRTNLLKQEVGNKTLAIHYQGVLQNMAVSRFMFFRSEAKNVYGMLDTGEELLIDDTLKNLEQCFSGDFIRVHRAALMNKQQAGSLLRDDNGGASVKLRDGDFCLPVSRRHLSEVKKCFQ